MSSKGKESDELLCTVRSLVTVRNQLPAQVVKYLSSIENFRQFIYRAIQRGIRFIYSTIRGKTSYVNFLNSNGTEFLIKYIAEYLIKYILPKQTCTT